MTLRIMRLLVGLGFVALLLLGPAAMASAGTGVYPLGSVNVQVQESPYAPPDIQEVEAPSWLRPLQPLARLPLWGQAAVLSAGVAGMFLVVPLVFRWVWKLGEGHEDESEPEAGEGHEDESEPEL